MLDTLKRHARAAAVAGLFAACTGVPIASGVEISGGVVRIGVINDQTGFLFDPTGKGSVVATQMAVEDFQTAALARHQGRGGRGRPSEQT